ncbi:cell wall protein DAN4 isoform X2 [Harpegnathos saltator]|nr:cell wall protein DAN4 isoform X2 [Harpegnathos saltator]
MKVLWCHFMVILILRQATAGIVRKPPAFSTPVYSNSYLPAAMQVIFHAVEQLKLLQSEEMLLTNSAVQSSSTTQSMKHQQLQSTTPKTTPAISTIATTAVHSKTTGTPKLSSTSPSIPIEASSHGLSETYNDLTKAVQPSTTSVSTSYDHEETPEVNEETAETNYATPETNHESPEPVQETQEPNQEISEVNEEDKISTIENYSGQTSEVGSSLDDGVSQQQSKQVTVSETQANLKKKEPTIDSVVDEIYVIVKPTISPLIDISNITDMSKGTTGISIEKMESIEDEEEETRFTLLGEKVAQVPRPSLNSYLRRTKVPPSRALQQLANLYDALSKDARKQGFARFTGYSDEVLQALQSSAEGGVGPQLKTLLEKVVERSELTRDDAKSRTTEALRDLDDPASALNKDLRRLLPLRYTA